MKNMKNMKSFLTGGVVILVAAILLTWLVQSWVGGDDWYAVYMRTGDLYFGRLVRFPNFGLKQVYLLQVNRDTPQSPLSIQRFSNVFWGPEDFLQINREEVVWTARLNSNGQLAQLIQTNPNLIPPAAESVQQIPQQQTTPNPTSSKESR